MTPAKHHVWRSTIAVAALDAPERRRELHDVMADTGSASGHARWTRRSDLGVARPEARRRAGTTAHVMEGAIGEHDLAEWRRTNDRRCVHIQPSTRITR